MPSAILYYHCAVDRNTDTCVHIASVSRTDFDEQIRILTGLSKYRPASLDYPEYQPIVLSCIKRDTYRYSQLFKLLLYF